MPPSGFIIPAAIFSSVDLPEPLRPTRQIRSPALDADRRAVQQGLGPKRRMDVLQQEKGGCHGGCLASRVPQWQASAGYR